jgi:hypothetical protein
METHRQEILLLLSSLKANSEINTILGLNKALGAKTQLKIRDDLKRSQHLEILRDNRVFPVSLSKNNLPNYCESFSTGSPF